MAEEKKKYPKFTTDIVTFRYAQLRKPDKKFKKYGVTARLPQEQAQVLIEMLQPIYNEAIEDAKAEHKAMPKAKRDKITFSENPFYSVVYDEDDEPTGYVDFSFGKKSSGERADGTQWKATPPPVFDARKKMIPSNVDVWGGSEGRIAFFVKPYFLKSTGLAGITLNLSGVQVTQLAAAGSVSADALGFDEEDGYSVDDFMPEGNDVDVDEDEEEEDDF